MSHQVRQLANVQFTSLEVLRRALPSVHIEALNTHLVLDELRKEARYWGGNTDRCDAVITYARPLTDQEKQGHYEIAVKLESDRINGVATPVYRLYADSNAGDRKMEEKLGKIAEEYTIQGPIRKRATAMGALEVKEVSGAPSGYRRIRVTVPG